MAGLRSAVEPFFGARPAAVDSPAGLFAPESAGVADSRRGRSRARDLDAASLKHIVERRILVMLRVGGGHPPQWEGRRADPR
ncbi:hypothetical protein GCM10009602_56950 [Nocardiopsis tropica]